ncbi:hypothetical protein ACP4OV_002071 [Aristida adscensionis]
MIIQQLHDHRVVLVNQDSFYRGLTAEESARAQDYNFDHPDAFDTEQLLECMGELKRAQPVNVPIYDFKKHRRCSESFRKGTRSPTDKLVATKDMVRLGEYKNDRSLQKVLSFGKDDLGYFHGLKLTRTASKLFIMDELDERELAFAWEESSAFVKSPFYIYY